MSVVTLEEVKSYLDISEGKTEEDALLTTLVAAVDSAFRKHTHREFEPTDGAMRRFAHHGGRLLNLSPFDLRSAETVKTGVEGATPSTLAITGYALRPLPAIDGVYQWIRFASDPGVCEVEIKGDWGFAEVPADIKHFALSQIALWLRRDLQSFERTFNIDGGFFERPEALSSAVRGGLAGYARVSLP